MITAIFADIPSIYNSIKIQYNGKLDYGKILNDFEGHEIVRAYAYGSQEPKEAASFIVALRELNFTPKFEKYGNWFSRMTIDAIQLQNKIMQAVFITDDVQYCHLMKFLQDQSIWITVYCVKSDFPLADRQVKMTRHYLDKTV